MRPATRDILGPALAVALFAAALYAVSLGGTYVFDDYGVIHNDPRVADPSQWGRYLYGREGYNDSVDNLYRPVTSLSYAVQAWLHGYGEGAAWAWHAVNVLLYAVVCGLVAALAGRLRSGDQPESDGRRVALAAGLIFAALPVHVEAVAGIVGRAELLCGAGFVGGLILLTRPLTPARIAAFVALLFLSIGAKEQGLLLPAVALAWYTSRRRFGKTDFLRGRGKTLFLAVALPLAGYLLWRESILPMAWDRSMLDPTIQTMVRGDASDRLLMPLAILGRYAGLLVWPARLSLDYGAGVIDPPQLLADPYLWLGVGVCVLYVVAVVHAIRARWAAGLTLLLAAGLTYGPASNTLALAGTVFGERLVLLPSAFVVLWAVLLAARSRLPRRPAAVAVALLVLAGAARSLAYAVHWNDRTGLYEHQAQVQPRSVRIQLLLGQRLIEVGRLDEAAEAGRLASEVAPYYWDAWLLRAAAAEAAGDLESALAYADRAVEAKTFVKTVARREQIAEALHQRDRAE